MAGRMVSTIVLVSATILNPIVAQAASLEDVLKQHANLSSLEGLLSSQIPDFYKTLQGYDEQNPVTILAPSNSAFAKIPYYDVIGPAWANSNWSLVESILQYHVLPGEHSSKTLNSSFQFLETQLTGNISNVSGGQRIGAVLQAGYMPQIVFTSGESNRAIVAQADISFDGGIIHVIDSFNIPPLDFAYTAEKYALAIEANSITSFLGAIYSNENKTLAQYLNTTEDITVFAPINAGVKVVGGELTSLDSVNLNDLLEYHVVIGQSSPVYSTSFTNSTTLTTLQGQELTVTFSSNSYFINSARVLTSDLLLSNGVMHVIDNVLSPNNTNAQANPSLATQQPVLATSMPAGMSFNSSSAPFTTFLPNIVSTDTAATAAATGDGGDSGSGGSYAGYTQTASSGYPSSTGSSANSLQQNPSDARWWTVAQLILTFVLVMTAGGGTLLFV